MLCNMHMTSVAYPKYRGPGDLGIKQCLSFRGFRVQFLVRSVCRFLCLQIESFPANNKTLVMWRIPCPLLWFRAHFNQQVPFVNNSHDYPIIGSNRIWPIGVPEMNSLLLPSWVDAREIKQAISGGTRQVVSIVWAMTLSLGGVQNILGWLGGVQCSGKVL
jgi:hypothetical protein